MDRYKHVSYYHHVEALNTDLIMVVAISAPQMST